MMLRTNRPRCEAVTGWRHLDSGASEPVRCRQHVGLAYINGHPFCPAAGHRERVLGQAKRGYVPA
jgi:hypothetical protein